MMAMIDNPKMMSGAPIRQFRHNIADHSAAKEYFIHRHKLDRFLGRRRSAYHKPDPAFILMPRKAHSGTNRIDEGQNLLRLPGELILDILDLLPPVDALSLRITCRYIRGLSSSISLQSRLTLRDADFDKYAWRLRKDCFNRLVEYEEANDDSRRYTPRDRLLCSYCLDFHPRSAFGALETEGTAVNARERQCTASASTIYICPHTQMAFEDFLRLSRTPSADYIWPACTQLCSSYITSCKRFEFFRIHQPIPIFPTGKDELGERTEPSTSIKCKRCFTACFPNPVALAMAIKATDNMDTYLCPHVRGEHPIADIFKKVIESSCWHTGDEHKGNDTDVMLKECTRKLWICDERGCGAMMDVICDGKGVEIQTSRQMFLTTVMSESWWTSVEHPVQVA